MKLYLEPITVTPARDGWPVRIAWRRNSYKVTERVEKWLSHTKWWWLTPEDLRGEQRRYYRVSTLSPGGHPVVMEVYERAGEWMLSRMED